MKLIDIINYLGDDRVILWVQEEMVFEGFISDIPWVYLDYYLLNDIDGKAISARCYGEDKGSGFIISLSVSKN